MFGYVVCFPVTIGVFYWLYYVSNFGLCNGWVLSLVRDIVVMLMLLKCCVSYCWLLCKVVSGM